MNDEKRVIDTYEVRHAVKFCGREYILAEDKSAGDDILYMTGVGRWDNPFGVEVHENIVVSKDYLEIFDIFLNRLTEQSKKLSAERNEYGTTDKPLTTEDCIKSGLDQSIEGKVIIIKPTCLSAEYRTASHQIKLAIDGFGCSPNSRGSAVFCTDLYSGKTSRFERHDVAGVADITKLPRWAQQRITELDKAKDKPSMLETLAKNKIVAAQQEVKKNEKKKEVQEL